MDTNEGEINRIENSQSFESVGFELLKKILFALGHTMEEFVNVQEKLINE